MTGVAREVGAVTGKAVREPRFAVTETSGTVASDLVSVAIEDAGLCSRYTARVIRNVKIGPSPAWLAERVTAAGARPINNVVDITNYVMFELGQPLHAFDLGTITAEDGRPRSSCVRTGRRGAENARRAGARAHDGHARDRGPVGRSLWPGLWGEATEVTETSTDILLEAACFHRASISKTSRQLGLISEASLRFERGVDPAIAVRASDRAAALLAEFAGGEIAEGIVDAYPEKARSLRITLRPARMNAFLGISLKPQEIIDILGALGLFAEPAGAELAVTVPTSVLTCFAKSTSTRRSCGCGAWSACHPRCPEAGSVSGLSRSCSAAVNGSAPRCVRPA